MILPAVIKEFLNQPRDDHAWLKDVPVSKIDSALAGINPRPRFEDMMINQKVGMLLGISYPGFVYLYDMGTGKSLLMLRLLEWYYQIGYLKGVTVVLVKNDAAVDSWEEQIGTWGCPLPYRMLIGSSAQKWNALKGFTRGIVLVSYPGYAAMVSELKPVRNDPAKKRRKRMKSAKLIARLTEHMDGLVMDESTEASNTKSLTYKTVLPLSRAAKVRYALAGRPFGRDPQLLWPQFFLADHGETLSDTKGVFLQAFFQQKRNWFSGGFEYKIDKKKKAELASFISHRSLAYEIQECTKLPKKVPQIIRVGMTAEQLMYYNKAAEQIVMSKGNWQETKNSFIRMRQIASGFLTYRNEDTGEKAILEFKKNPKLDELLARLAELDHGRKALVFHEYTWTGARICRALGMAGYGHGWLRGGTDNWPEMKIRFNTDPKFRVLVINHKKGAFSLNLQAASYVAIMESPVSPISRDQLERRAWRPGQKNTVLQDDIVCKDSVDESILEFHKEGNSLFDALVRNPQSVLRL